MTGREPPAGAFDRRLLVPLVLGAILNPVNSSILAVSLIPIGADFGAPPAQTAWLISGLYLATAIGQPVVGRLIDSHGPRRLFLASTALTGLAGLVGMLAPNLAVLVIARILLGFGTCAGYPAAMYLIRREQDRTGQRGSAGVLTVLSVAGQTVAVIGPTLGGLLIGVGGWRATLAVNLPLAAAALAAGWRVLPRQPTRPGGVRLDLLGMLLFAATLASLLLFLMDPHGGHLALLAAAVVAAAACWWWELRAPEPFLDVRGLGRNGPLLLTYLRNMLCYTVAYAFLYGYSQWLQDGRGLAPETAGLLLMPMSAIGIGAAAITGRHHPVRGKLVVGTGCQLVIGAGMLLLTDTSSVLVLIGIAAIAGVPQGLIGLANQNAVYHQADPERIASSAGLLRTFMYLGAMTASAATGSAFGPVADTAGLHRLAVVVLVASALTAVLVLADRSLRRIGHDPLPDPDSTGGPPEGTPMPIETLDSTAALVLIDLQRGIVAAPREPYPADEVVQRCARLAGAFRARGLPVVLVRVSTAPDGADATPGRTDAAGPGGSRPQGWDELVAELAAQPSDIVVTKRNWGAFYGTDLDLQLRRRGITQIVLGGIATSMGVESTARAAHEHGYHVVLVEDAMTGPDAESHHHSVHRIFPRLGQVTTADRVLAVLPG